MAALLGAQAGRSPFLQNGYMPACLLPGTPASSGALAGAVSITIPTDPQGNAYKAVQIVSSGAVWINFSSDGTAPSIAGANCFLVTSGSPLLVVPPSGATKVGAIPATASTTPDVCVTGLF